MVHRFLLVACITLAGCATGDGEEGSTPAKDAAATDAVGDSRSIFAVDDTATSPEPEPGPDDTGASPAEDSTAPAPDTRPVDTGPATLAITIDGIECRVITCPSTHPYVVGCSISMSGLSTQGCAVHVPGGSTVLFKEGQSCGDIAVKGTVVCSTAPGMGLNKTNCPTDKSTQLYVTTIGACPT